MTAWILGGRDARLSRHAGGKARALADAERAGLPVPPWFVLSADAFDRTLTAGARAAFAGGADAAAMTAMVDALPLDPAVARELDAAVRSLCPRGELVAVRSSASDEDGPQHSFAGQLESYLNVAPRDVPDRVRAVWRSAFTDRIVTYRREHGLPPVPRAPAVLIQRMVDPRAAGVAFSADPISGRRGIAVVSAVFGLGSAVVSGEADADTWLVDRNRVVVERRIASKRHMHAADAQANGGVRTVDVPAADAGRPALSDEEAIAVADLARAAERHFGRPQDIEWAMTDRLVVRMSDVESTRNRRSRVDSARDSRAGLWANGTDRQLVLLQTRPITSLAALPDPDGRLTIWDNSNIVESYSGVTTPLTFSFAREIYAYVYQQFCRMMGVPESAVAGHDDVFRNMLGLIRGRLYYNLLNWYRVLALLPGYEVNRRFMEQMMGVKERLPDALAADIAAGTTRGRARDAMALTRTLAGLAVNHFTIDRRVEAFYRRLDAALALPSPRLEEQRPDELVAYYRGLRERLLLSWDAPIVNDFFAMIFYGLLRHLVTRWCGDAAGTLQNDLIGGEGGIVSAEPAVRLLRLARLAQPNPTLVAALVAGTPEDVEAAMKDASAFAAEVASYVEKFGDRTVNELKLESATLHDDPQPLYRAIGALAQQIENTPGPAGDASAPSSGDRLRAEARSRVDGALARRPFRRLVFHWVLGHARRRVRDRENLRLERTRLFGRVRRIFLELGRRLHALDLLDDPRDVMYLEVDEALAFVEGRATCTDLRSLVAARRREFRAYEDGPPPDDRFETHGLVYHAHDFRHGAAAAPASGDTRQGLGCSPGTVRGPVRVVRDPRAADLQPRAILVAEHTDPGWIMVFPSALGVLVERGSLLSHAAIVARELGIPAVVSVPGLTRWLRDGDSVEMDGATGTIRRLAATDA